MHDSSSSPDPLNDTYLSPGLSHLSRPKQTPPKSSSRKRQIFQLDVGNDISPKKIRVTVEAGEIGDKDVNGISRSPSRPTARQKQRASSEKTSSVNRKSNNTLKSSNHRGLNATPKRGIGRYRKSPSTSPSKKSAKRNKKTTSSRFSGNSLDLAPDGTSTSQITHKAKSAKVDNRKKRSSSLKLKRESQIGSLSANILDKGRPLMVPSDEIEIEQSDCNSPHVADVQHHNHYNISPAQTDIVHMGGNNIENETNFQLNYHDESLDGRNASKNFNTSSLYCGAVENNSHKFVRPSPQLENYYLSNSKSGDVNYPSPASLEKQISPETQEISANTFRAHSNQSVALKFGYQDEGNLIRHGEIIEREQSNFTIESEESSMISGDSNDSLKDRTRNSSIHGIRLPRIQSPNPEAEISAGNSYDHRLPSFKIASGLCEKDSEDEEGLDLLLQTLNSSSSTLSRYQDKAQSPRTSKSPSPCDSTHKEAIYKEIPTLVFSSTKLRNHEINRHSNDYTIDTVANIEQEEDNYLQSPEFPIHRISRKASFHPNTEEGLDSDLLCLQKNLSNTSPCSQQTALRKFAKNDPTLEFAINQNESDSINMIEDDRSLSPIPQDTSLKPQSEILLSSPLIPSSTASRQSSNLLNSSPTPLKLNPKAFDISNGYKSPTAIRGKNLISPSQTISFDKEKPNSNDHVLEWTKSIDHSLESLLQNEVPKKTPPNSPTKSCMRFPKKASIRPSSVDTPNKAVTFVSSSPSLPLPPNDSLSGTIWSKEHWLCLDKIVQSWKPEHLASKNNHQKEKSSRNSTRVISQLLGNYVFSAEGERMKLEQWHLQAVDEFRGQVPGWEEKTIAMRVFALLVGERLRAEQGIAVDRALQ